MTKEKRPVQEQVFSSIYVLQSTGYQAERREIGSVLLLMQAQAIKCGSMECTEWINKIKRF